MTAIEVLCFMPDCSHVQRQHEAVLAIDNLPWIAAVSACLAMRRQLM